ncbi:MAG: SprT-like domain-containing protein [Thiotrichales bacterium]|nr:MAG: SprT-like domain-containing protein [Thiotrichales bacterium]
MKNPEHVSGIEPISCQHQQQVRSLTADYIDRACRIYGCKFPLIPVMFDLKGRAAGMYRVHKQDRRIRFNPYIFAKYYEDNLATTVPHEVAHYVVDLMYNARSVKPHGAEWQQVMRSFGVEPKATGDYDLSGIPVRKHRRHAYQCTCATHEISSVRHNRIRQGKARYYCRKCKSALIPLPTQK